MMFEITHNVNVFEVTERREMSLNSLHAITWIKCVSDGWKWKLMETVAVCRDMMMCFRKRIRSEVE